MADKNKIVQIDIKRTGFPVVVGDIELYFDSSLENLRKFLTLDELIEAKTEELQKVLDSMPEDGDPNSLASGYDKAQMILKAQAEISWDTTFGEGTFSKLYKKYSDLWALSDAFDAVGLAIGEQIEKMASERLETVEDIKKEALAKKAEKTASK